MFLSAILNTYQTHDKFAPRDYVSNDYWFFVNQANGMCKKRECGDLQFLLDVIGSGACEKHQWCHVPNYCNTQIKPFMPYDTYLGLLKRGEQFTFDHLADSSTANEVLKMGQYAVWPNISAKFFGWMVYLKIKHNVTLAKEVPLPHHQQLGNINLFTNYESSLDCFCTFSVDDKVWFCNGPHYDAHHQIMELQIFDKAVPVYFAPETVGTKNFVLFDFLVNDERITACKFVHEYEEWGEVDLHRLRKVDATVMNDDVMDCDDVLSDSSMSDIKISPSSIYMHQFEVHIKECLALINDAMLEGMPNNGCGPNFLQEYMLASNFSTFPYLIINVWYYCLGVINFHNQYKLEDILMFVHILCSEFTPSSDHLYKEHKIYVNSKENAQKFFASLTFFDQPQVTLGFYFAIHYAIFKKFCTWHITTSHVRECELDKNVVSFGFFKKIKHNELSYIFNGKIYEYVKNKKDHDIASAYDKADETQVSVFKFNSILNFYLTEDGMFDVCKKIYRQPCPFVVMSALKKNYISKNDEMIERRVFDALYASMKTDVQVLKTYHAKKFEIDFNTAKTNFNDCRTMVTSKLRQRTVDKLKTMVSWLLNTNESMIVILMMKKNLQEYIDNIICKEGPVDLMGLQLAITLQFLMPKSDITQFVWSLLKCDMLFMYMMKDHDELNKEVYYEKKKIIIENLHEYIKKNVERVLECNDVLLECIKSAAQCGKNTDDYKKTRLLTKMGQIYTKYKRVPINYPVWTDKLIEFKKNTEDDMYSWLSRFYVRIYLRTLLDKTDINLLTNVVQGFCYFRVLTNFNTTSSKAIIHFCASLAIPTDYEKMCLVITSEPNCGKSSLFEILDKIILVYKSDRKFYDHSQEDRSSKIKRFESQLYIMNEAERTTKGYLKNIADSTKFDSANRKYGPEETFYANYKVMVTNNEMLFVKDGYDKACSNRIGQIYIDHSFESDMEKFDGSIYEHYESKKYCEIKDINTKLVSPIKQFLANVLFYKSDPKTGYVYYKSVLKNDKCYKHNKKCLYIYNDRLEALLYVLDIREIKAGETPNKFTEAYLVDMITKCVDLVKQMVHYKLQEQISDITLLADFRRKYGRGKHYNPTDNTYENLTIVESERFMKTIKPKLKSSIAED
ncbi:DNA helicase [Hyphantria cunea granulovirus]|uniref:DNA helicase n=1 Tax=Hyphantria cunea granulovirus TaxID=307448 RepID=A0AAF1D292_9BBAC|nr:DNA helicase [Hyphantria cunea granulovirus]QBQ01632.1 DNA helicase [Hyphantria cunea granulovirus]